MAYFPRASSEYISSIFIKLSKLTLEQSNRLILHLSNDTLIHVKHFANLIEMHRSSASGHEKILFHDYMIRICEAILKLFPDDILANPSQSILLLYAQLCKLIRLWVQLACFKLPPGLLAVTWWDKLFKEKTQSTVSKYFEQLIQILGTFTMCICIDYIKAGEEYTMLSRIIQTHIQTSSLNTLADLEAILANLNGPY